MDKFNNIIRQKAEQFEVPFNDAHWAEMDAKLNGIHSTKKKILFFGSTAATITVILSVFFLFPTNTTTDLNSNHQIPAEKTSANPGQTSDQPTAAKKDKIKNPVIQEEKITEKNSEEAIAIKVKTVVNPPKKTVKETTEILPIVVAEKRKLLTPELKVKVKPSVVESDLKFKISKTATLEEKAIENPTKKAVNTIQPQTTKLKIPETVSVEKTKNIKRKAYEDENVSKKSIKRRRRGILSFISFRKKIYKVPLSRKKPKKIPTKIKKK